MVYAKTRKQTVRRCATKYCKMKLERTFSWRIPGCFCPAGFIGVKMDCLATSTMMESSQRLCAKRRRKLNEQAVHFNVWDEWQSVDRVLKRSLLRQRRGKIGQARKRRGTSSISSPFSILCSPLNGEKRMKRRGGILDL